MRATVIYGAGDVRVKTVPDPVLQQPSDALVCVVRACICGSDLWPYGSMPDSEGGERIGHEFLGVIEDTGSEVEGFAPGDLVVAPFVWSDGTCDFCRQGLQTSCRHGGLWARNGIDGGQGEAVRVPQAQGTLVKLPVASDSALLASLLTLSDVFPTGHHCAVKAGVNPRSAVTVIGDGAVGLCAVLAAKRLGAGRNHDQLFPGHVSTLAGTDPELIEYFDNFAFDEVLAHDDLDQRTRLSCRVARVSWLMAGCGGAGSGGRRGRDCRRPPSTIGGGDGHG